MAMAPQFISGLAEIAGRYRHTLMDLWGCVHNGVEPYPGAIDCLCRLRAAGTTVLLLSNAPRPHWAVAERLAGVGVPEDCYDAILSSGDATIRALNERIDPWHRALGRRYFHLGPARSAGMIREVADEAVAFEAADYILVTGPVDDEAETAADYRPLLEAALKRRLPMVSANPDLVVMRGDKVVTCAGSLARLYTEMGGEVREHGKPQASIYEMAFERLGQPERAAVLMVGDGLFTDIAGAAGFGIDSLWLAAGIHGAEAGYEPGRPLDRARISAALEALGAHPTYVTESLAW
jgi:HAD superfamily hydrolase (TIGR01459 family)